MKTYLVALACLRLMAFAESPKGTENPPDWGSKTFVLQHADPEQLRRVFSSQAYVMDANRELHTLSAKGPQAFLAEVERTVKQFDIAPAIPPNVQITVYLLAPGGSAGNLPVELKDQIKEIESLTGRDGWRLADAQSIRVRAGEGAETSRADAPADGVPAIHRFQFRSASVTTAAKTYISLNGVRVSLRPGVSDAGFSADVDISDKSVVLLGKTGSDKPLVAALKAEVR